MSAENMLAPAHTIKSSSKDKQTLISTTSKDYMHIDSIWKSWYNVGPAFKAIKIQDQVLYKHYDPLLDAADFQRNYIKSYSSSWLVGDERLHHSPPGMRSAITKYFISSISISLLTKNDQAPLRFKLVSVVYSSKKM